MKNVEKYEKMLLEEKGSLEEELSEIALFNPETNTWEATPDRELMGETDDNDAADRFEDFEERSGMVSTLRDRLYDVNLALTKIETGVYGICEISGDKIEEDRLMANPAARTNKANIDKI